MPNTPRLTRPSGLAGRALIAAAAAAACLPLAAAAQGQGGQAQPQEQEQTARAAAPIDLTGDWVSIVTEDWRYRMVTPARGDYTSIPINQAAREAADAWDPARDTQAGEQCRSYGAPAIMRVPGRLRISWENDETLKVETDAGMQTRLLRFDGEAAPQGDPSWQGHSKAEWRLPRTQASSFGPGVGEEQADGSRQPRFGSLKVVTTHLRPGYLRKNGVPYSDRTVLTEYWDLIRSRNGAQWIVITTVVEDPVYLQMPWVTSLNFRKEPDGTTWDPSPCSATW